jgi:hypothetical protein
MIGDVLPPVDRLELAPGRPAALPPLELLEALEDDPEQESADRPRIL